MKHVIVNRKEILRFFATALLVFGVPGILFTSLFIVGCSETEDDTEPETATVMVEVSSPKVLEPADALHLTVSTDFGRSLSDEIIYNTKKEFSITQDFNQTFQLDPDEPRIAGELIKPGPSGSVRLTVLLDDEVEHESSLPAASSGSMGFSRSFSQENITF